MQTRRPDGDKSNWTKGSHSAALVKNRIVLVREAKLDKKEDFLGWGGEMSSKAYRELKETRV